MNVRRLIRAIIQLQKDERAQDLIEYALLAGFLATACAAIVPGIGQSFNSMLSRVNVILVNIVNAT